MFDSPSTLTLSPRPTAPELRRLTAGERDAILAAQAAEAEAAYRGDPALTDFEAYGEGHENGDNAADAG